MSTTFKGEGNLKSVKQTAFLFMENHHSYKWMYHLNTKWGIKWLSKEASGWPLDCDASHSTLHSGKERKWKSQTFTSPPLHSFSFAYPRCPLPLCSLFLLFAQCASSFLPFSSTQFPNPLAIFLGGFYSHVVEWSKQPREQTWACHN